MRTFSFGYLFAGNKRNNHVGESQVLRIKFVKQTKTGEKNIANVILTGIVPLDELKKKAVTKLP